MEFAKCLFERKNVKNVRKIFVIEKFLLRLALVEY